jgi:signal transduction histidine kinase
VKKKVKIIDSIDNLKIISKEQDISDQIINHSRSMISVINRNYVYEKVNNTFCNAHKIFNNAVVGKSLEEVWGNDSFYNSIKNNLDICFTGKTVKYEASFDTPGLGKRYFEVVFRPIFLESGEITHILAETFDINDLRKSKLAALKKEEELRKFERNLPIGFIRCNKDGKILHANRAFFRIMDCPPDYSSKDMNIKSFYPDKGMFDMQFQSLLEYSSKTFGRLTLQNFKGREVPCRISGFLSHDSSGLPLRVDLIIEDSTRELMLENRLLQAQKLETVGSLAGGIAHDFNNILATISGYAELLKDDLPEDSELSEKVSKIQGAVVKAQSITSQILTFSRHAEQEKIPVSVADVLRETIGFVKSSVPDKISVKSRLPKKQIVVYADPTQLFRVFLNLMTNAMQAMEENGGILSVNLETVDGKHLQHYLNKENVAIQYALVTFKDTGVGMEPSVMGRIFEPFFTTHEVGKGTGLGLSVIHGIITEMEGEIIVTSKKNKGSTFQLYIPVSEISADITENNNGRKNILLIKGNKYESRIFSLALEKSGYKLIYISERKKLAELFSDNSQRTDLIIYMSDSKSIKPDDLVEMFGKLNINIPLLLITDPQYKIVEEKILNSGIISQHLIQPVSLKEIRNAIQTALRGENKSGS